tara:strand:- start:2455 stop:3582 length:1128 start_codon:yes stop_codon:yes gene_type:complete
MYGSKVVELNDEEILGRISCLDIFSYYIGKDFKLGKAIRSPLRKDKSPSFTIFKHNSGRYFYKDFSTGETGDCFTFLVKMYSIKRFDTYRLVDNDFQLGISTQSFTAPTKKYVGKHIKELEDIEPSSTTIQIKSRAWNGQEDKKFWGKYGICCKILDKYNVKPVEHVWINDNLIVSSNKYNPIYAYDFGDGKFKIYQPYNKSHKWLSNTSAHDLQGSHQLPESCETLVITKSLKDVMCLDIFGIYAVAPSSESCIIPKNIVDNLYKRFNKIYILYDFDRTGVSFANKHKKLYNFIPLFFTNGKFNTFDFKSKDLSDYIANNSVRDAAKLIEIICIEEYSYQEMYRQAKMEEDGQVGTLSSPNKLKDTIKVQKSIG